MNDFMRQTLQGLFRRFHYTRDGKLDHWRIHKNGTNVYGDCEDFALTLLYDLSGRSMWKFWWNQITFRAVIWYVTSYQGDGHAILWYRGWWADNMERDWYLTKDMRHKRRFPWLAPFVALKLTVGSIMRRWF